MFVGPVFTREAATTPRRARLYFFRTVYATALLVLMCTAWLVLAGTQVIRNVGDLARFGSILFQILAPLQLALVVFLSALLAASAVAQEKDRKTLILLLMTRISNSELVLGKLLASLLNVMVMLAAALPVFMFLVLFGGVSVGQIVTVFAVTVMTALVAGSLGSVFAFWREKTFQTLSLTALTLVFWVGVWEAVGLIDGADPLLGVSYTTWATGFSPLRAVLAATSPLTISDPQLGVIDNGVSLFLLTSLAGTALLSGIAIWRVRVWNPTREVRPGQGEQREGETIWGAEHDLAESETRQEPDTAEVARSEHVDARVREADTKSREVWDNPVLWREIRTRAYGRKVIAIKLAYIFIFAMVAFGLHATLSGDVAAGSDEVRTAVPASSAPLAPFFLVSVVIVNALSVTSITNERDGLSLDLLLVTDLSPREFVFGKLGGIFWVTREMIVLPSLLCVYLCSQGGMSVENLFYTVGLLLVMNVFAAVLGVHCGMTYANSRSAIAVSLGTLFFLFLGVVTLLLMMISFSGSFQTQLAPFLAFILGGGVGLFMSLGARNPSRAIAMAALVLPFATFFAITSFLLKRPISMFLVTSAAYGFTTTAMLMPALGEFDIAMGRTKTADDG